MGNLLGLGGYQAAGDFSDPHVLWPAAAPNDGERKPPLKGEQKVRFNFVIPEQVLREGTETEATGPSQRRRASLLGAHSMPPDTPRHDPAPLIQRASVAASSGTAGR